MIVLTGRSCSGKDAILNKLVKEYGYKSMVTYTTRPMRKNEIQNKTYNFISDESFIKKIEVDFFLEYRKYNTVDGVWYYGSAKEDYEKADDNTVIILTPSGLKSLKEYVEKYELNLEIISIYIDVDIDTIKKRLEKRGDKKEEAERRVEADSEDFKDIELDVDTVFHNNDGVDISDIVKHIDSYIKEKKINE